MVLKLFRIDGDTTSREIQGKRGRFERRPLLTSRLRARAVAMRGGGALAPGKIKVLSANRFRNQLKYLSGSDEKVIVIAKL
jgi:hypothetical protein